VEVDLLVSAFLQPLQFITSRACCACIDEV